MRKLALALAAIGSLAACSPPDPLAGIFQWTNPESGVTTWIEYEGRGWRNLRIVELHAQPSPQSPDTTMEVYWVCNSDTLLLPSRYSEADGTKVVSIGDVQTNARRFFELNEAQFVAFQAALNEICSSPATFDEAPANILLSYDDDSITHLEASRLQRTGAKVNTWIRVEALVGGVNNRNSSIDQAEGIQLAEVQFDCSNGTWATNRLELFNPDGSPQATLPFSGEFISVVPGTQADARLTTTCLIE